MPPPAVDPTPGLNTPTASAIGETTATASVSGSNFEYIANSLLTFYYVPTAGGTTKSNEATIAGNNASASLTGLTAGTSYTLYASCTATNGKAVQSPTTTFTTPKPAVVPAIDKTWLEIPATMSSSAMGGVTLSNQWLHTFYYGSESDSNRNYTVCYDKGKLTTYWVAYPLNSSHSGSAGRNEAWAYVSSSLLAESLQPNIKSGSYRSSSSGGTNNYSRGHLLPSNSRQNTVTMNEQTFLSVNLVPQIHTGFNGGVWQDLEAALQTLSKSDDLYIVTGTALQKGSNEEIDTMERTYDQSGKEIAVPRYFYKVVLKVNSASSPSSASAIGFWFTNKSHSGTSYEAFAMSVDEIEQKLGMDFFVNLPDTVENSAETNTSWSSFQSF